MRTPVLCVLLFGGLIAPAQAQTIWSRPYQPDQVALEVLIPERSGDASEGLSGAGFLTVTHSFNENLQGIVELPVARAGGPPSSTALGNPYVGLGLSSTRVPLLVEIGVRIPAGPTNRARAVGRRADPGRTAAFRDETVSLSGLLNGRLDVGRNTSLRLRAGLSYGSVRTGSGVQGQWQIPYSAQLWRSGEWLLTGLSVTGRPSFSSFAGDTRRAHHAVLSVMLNGNYVQPGLLVGTGLDPLFTEGRLSVLGGVTLSISYGR
ncbi:MAG: hypothetical protein ABEK84_08340 [Salinibacter sp.]